MTEEVETLLRMILGAVLAITAILLAAFIVGVYVVRATGVLQ